MIRAKKIILKKDKKKKTLDQYWGETFLNAYFKKKLNKK